LPNPTPLILELANRFRAQALARERRAANALVRYYGTAYGRLHNDVMALQQTIEQMRAAGEDVSRGTITRLERMTAIQNQAAREAATFAEFADQQVQAGQREAIKAAERNGYDLITAAFPAGADLEAIGVTFYRMPAESVENLVGTLADGSPLRDLISQAVGGAADDFSQTMVTGLAAGWNPRKLARELRTQYGMGLTRALTISRTEQLRAYRETNRQVYDQSPVVDGWERHAAKDDRTCMACIARDGELYSTKEAMDDHPNGRCFMLPHTKSYAELGIDAPEPEFKRETAKEWFRRQDEATQRAMLGDAKFEAWQDGRFRLEDVAKRVDNPVWGNSWVPKSLGELVVGAVQ